MVKTVKHDTDMIWVMLGFIAYALVAATMVMTALYAPIRLLHVFGGLDMRATVTGVMPGEDIGENFERWPYVEVTYRGSIEDRVIQDKFKLYGQSNYQPGQPVNVRYHEKMKHGLPVSQEAWFFRLLSGSCKSQFPTFFQIAFLFEAAFAITIALALPLRILVYVVSISSGIRTEWAAMRLTPGGVRDPGVALVSDVAAGCLAILLPLSLVVAMFRSIVITESICAGLVSGAILAVTAAVLFSPAPEKLASLFFVLTRRSERHRALYVFRELVLGMSLVVAIYHLANFLVRGDLVLLWRSFRVFLGMP